MKENELVERLRRANVIDQRMYISSLYNKNLSEEDNLKLIKTHLIEKFNIHQREGVIKDAIDEKSKGIDYHAIYHDTHRWKKFGRVYHDKLDSLFFCPKCRSFQNRDEQNTKMGICRKCKAKIDASYKKENKEAYDKYQKSEQFVFSQLKYQAKKRGYTFEISYEDYLALANKPCYYCGSVETKHWIDRKINNMGYTKTNSVPCCELCNKMKSHREERTFIEHCKKVAANQK